MSAFVLALLGNNEEYFNIVKHKTDLSNKNQEEVLSKTQSNKKVKANPF